MSADGSRAGKNSPRPGKKKGKAGKKGKRGGKRSGSRTPRPIKPDPSDAEDTETRFVQPYEASKNYLCPGCNGDIPPGLGHLVAVPRSAPDLRRHWHRGCWTNRHNRR